MILLAMDGYMFYYRSLEHLKEAVNSMSESRHGRKRVLFAYKITEIATGDVLKNRGTGQTSRPVSREDMDRLCSPLGVK